MVIALEGLPGSGKTTSARLLAQELGAAVLCETTQDHPFLETVYDDARRYDLNVELAFLLLHNAGYRRVGSETTAVSDYSPAKDLVFAEAMLAGRELDLFVELYEQLYAGYRPPKLVVYLDASPELCLQRITERLRTDRSRAFEAGMDISRLRLMQSLYASRSAELGETVKRLAIHPEDTVDDVVENLLPLVQGDARPGTTR